MELTNGINLDLIYKGDVQSVVSGGVNDNTNYLGTIDVQLTLDGDQLFHIPGATVFLYLLNHHGGHPNDHVGSVQGVNNIEAPVAATKLYEAWIEKCWFEDRLSLRFGLYDTNTEFYVNDAAGLFIHPAFGMGQEMAQAGLNGPSAYPYTSLTARALVKPTEWSYLQFAVADGVPGDVDRPRGTHVDLDEKDGTLQLGELGLILPAASDAGSARGKIGFGGWRFTMPFDDVSDVDVDGNPIRDDNYGIYALADYRIYTESPQDDQGLTLFARCGYANDRVNQTDHAFEIGAAYLGLLPGRDVDQLGFGISAARNGSPFRAANIGVNGDALDKFEITYELAYKAIVSDHLSLQPLAQYVDNSDPGIDDALVLGMRAQLAY
ncbi:MAG: carbohydrate porin [Gammaproteobacteria bacterium]